MDIKNQIQKILALAASTTFQGERETALATAQRLMLQHRISEEDLHAARDRHVIYLPVRAGRRGKWWKQNLAAIVSENWCCYALEAAAAHRTNPDKWLVLMGFPEDVETAAAVILYLIDSVPVLWKSYKRTNPLFPSLKRLSKHGTEAGLQNAWIEGFLYGVRDRFRAVVDENERYALAIVKPPEVQAAHSQLDMKNKTPGEPAHREGEVLAGYVMRDGFEKGKTTPLRPGTSEIE